MCERSTFMMRVRHPAIVMFILAASVIFVTSCFGPNAGQASAQSRRPQKKVATPKKPRIDYKVLASDTRRHAKARLQLLPQSSLEELERSAQRRRGLPGRQ